MSNYIVDSADLTSIADAIRTKGGTSAQLAFPAEFVQAIENIETGGDTAFTPLDAVYSIKLVAHNSASATSLDVDFTKIPYIASLQGAFAQAGSSGFYTYREIAITPPNHAINCNQLVYASTAGHNLLQKFTIRGTLKPTFSGSQGALFSSSSNLVTVEGLIDLSSVSVANVYAATNYGNAFYNCSKLETIRFVPGTMSMATTGWYLSWCAKLTDESLVSIANALKDTYAGTITFHATPKARLSTIMGTVTSDGTLSTFAIDDSGTVSLMDFLTTTKGATIA